MKKNLLIILLGSCIATTCILFVFCYREYNQTLKIHSFSEKLLSKRLNPAPTGIISGYFTRLQLDKMISKLRESNDGVGIAGNQVGIDKRFFIVKDNDTYYKILNPEIISHSSQVVYSPEGCLSDNHSTRIGVVPRYWSIRIRYEDAYGKKQEENWEGFKSIIFQHEFDHINGIKFVDKAIGTCNNNSIPCLLQILRNYDLVTFPENPYFFYKVERQ